MTAARKQQGNTDLVALGCVMIHGDTSRSFDQTWEGPWRAGPLNASVILPPKG
jgi:hypothetical protein